MAQKTTLEDYSPFTQSVIRAWERSLRVYPFGPVVLPYILYWTVATILLMLLSNVNQKVATMLAVTLLLGQLLIAQNRGKE